MNILYEFTNRINIEAEKDAMLIRFNDLMPETRGKLAKFLKNGSSIFTIQKDSGPSIQKICNILSINNPIIWGKFGSTYNDNEKLCNYPLFRWRERMLSRIIYYATKKTPMTENQKSNIAYGMITPEWLQQMHEIQQGQREHNPEITP